MDTNPRPFVSIRVHSSPHESDDRMETGTNSLKAIRPQCPFVIRLADYALTNKLLKLQKKQKKQAEAVEAYGKLRAVEAKLEMYAEELVIVGRGYVPHDPNEAARKDALKRLDNLLNRLEMLNLADQWVVDDLTSRCLETELGLEGAKGYSIAELIERVWNAQKEHLVVCASVPRRARSDKGVSKRASRNTNERTNERRKER